MMKGFRKPMKTTFVGRKKNTIHKDLRGGREKSVTSFVQEDQYPCLSMGQRVKNVFSMSSQNWLSIKP